MSDTVATMSKPIVDRTDRWLTAGMVMLVLATAGCLIVSQNLVSWVAFLMTVLNMLGVVLRARMIRSARELGRWDERMELVESLNEAMRRGMSPGEWMVALHEKLEAEL